MNKSNWDDLRFALAVAEAGSVNAAAKRLNVNHATILRRIAAFEDACGLRVFEHRATGYRVRPEAAAVIAALRDVDAAVVGVARAVAGRGERLSGPLTITSTDSLCHTVLPRHVRAFQQIYPELRITVAATNSRLDLARLDADVTIRPARSLPADLTGRRAGRMDFAIYGAPSYWAQNPSARAEDHQWLGVTELLSRAPVGMWQQSLPEDRIVFRADSFVTLAAQAQTGMGLVMLPSFIGEGWENLATSEAFPDRLETVLWVAAHRDLAAAPRIAGCIDFLAAALADEPGLGG